MRDIILPIGSLTQAVLLIRNNRNGINRIAYTETYGNKRSIKINNSSWSNYWIDHQHSFLVNLNISQYDFTMFAWNEEYSHFKYNGVHMNNILIHVNNNGRQ